MASLTEDRKKMFKKVVRWGEKVVNSIGLLLGVNGILWVKAFKNGPFNDRLKVQSDLADINVLYQSCVILSIISVALFFLRKKL